MTNLLRTAKVNTCTKLTADTRFYSMLLEALFPSRLSSRVSALSIGISPYECPLLFFLTGVPQGAPAEPSVTGWPLLNRPRFSACQKLSQQHIKRRRRLIEEKQ